MGPAQQAKDEGADGVDSKRHREGRIVQWASPPPLLEAHPGQGTQRTGNTNGETLDDNPHSGRLLAGIRLGRVSGSEGGQAGGTPRHTRIKRQLLGTLITVVLVIVGFSLYLVWPILFPTPAGLSGQQAPSGYPSSVEATGEDGRTRTLSVTSPDGQAVALNEVSSGDRLVVSGSGYDPRNGIYVAVCKIPSSPDQRPGPCLGGVPSTDVEGDDGQRAIDWAPANWINDDWAWKLFGARGFDDAQGGTFSAYLELTSPADEFVDCRVEQCGIFTRNDHTAIDNRMQDLYLPVAFAE